jgi:hypothetical protein
VLGRPTIVGSFAVQLMAYLAVVLMTYAVAKRLGGQTAAYASALVVASTPALLDYIHEYSFAVPAAAAFTAAVWAAVRSQNMSANRWACVWGVALGAMPILRTMTVAFIPSFIMLAVLQVAISPKRLRSLAGMAFGLLTAGVVAGPWYLAQGGAVFQYLTSFGYGAQSAQFGAERSLTSFTSWLTFMHENINQYIWLPIGLILLVGTVLFLIRVGSAIRRHRPTCRQVLGSPWFYLVVVVGEGLVALESSRNTGSGFLIPLVPTVVVLAVSSLMRCVAKGRRVTLLAMVVVVALSAPSLIAKTAFNGPASQPVYWQAPGIGPVTILDGRSTLDAYLSAEGEADSLDPKATRWVETNLRIDAVVDRIARAFKGAPVVFSFNHSLINVNTLRLNELIDQGTSQPILLLTPARTGAQNSYSVQLHSIFGSGDGIVVLCADSLGVFPPIINQGNVRSAIRGLGFRILDTILLPDASTVEIWAR